ncbi:MAG: DUF6263 family protein [Planctomycetota bacterium]|nr:DUF6263 family protein [Planctomycetota bacterium]
MLHRHNFAFAITGAVILAAPLHTAAAQESGKSAPLVTALEQGKEMVYELVQHQEVSIPEMGATRETDITTVTALRVKEAGDGPALVGLTYEAMALAVSQQGQSVAYDSREPSDSPMAQQLKPLIDAVVGATLDLRVAESGEVTEVEGLDALLSGPMGQALAQMLDEETLRRSFTQVFAVTPDRMTGSVGDTWTVTQRTPLDPNAAVVVELTLKIERIEGGETTISMTGDANLELSEMAESQGISGEITDVRIEGTIQRNAEDGTLRSYELNTAFELMTTTVDQMAPDAEDAAPAETTRRIVVSQESRTTLQDS